MNARDFTLRLAELLRREQAAMADFLLALAEFDRKRLWLELGHSSLFYFLHRELGLSKGAAYYRKAAAELVQRFPEIEAPLRDGRLCITSIVELAKVITAENREDVLPRFFHCSKREAKAVSAELHPVQAAPHRDVLTAVRNEAPAPEQPSVPSAAVTLVQPVEPHKLVHPVEPRPGDDLVQPDELPAPTGSGRDGPPRATPSMHVAREQRDVVEPLTAELRRFHVTVSRRFLEKLEAARGALSHARPAASTDEILEAALDLLLEQHAKKKGIVEKPPAKRRPSESNRLSAHVKRAVWTRDGGRCQWPLASGGICGSTLRVEFDHLVPRARGGPSTVDNVRLLCRVHNDVAARRIFGDEWMDRFTSQGPSEAVAAPESSAAPTPLA